MNVRATAKFVGTSPRKIGLVAALIRGRRAQDAVTVLNQTAKRATDPVGKVLRSAIANAENNYNLSAGDLVVESVLVGPGPTLKRFRPRAQGRAGAILKRTSHIQIVLRDEKAPKIVKASQNTASAELAKDSDSPRPKAADSASDKKSTPKKEAK